MVANATLDAVVTLAWVGPLALFLVAEAFLAWLGHRHATRSAREAARLARATSVPDRPKQRARSVPALRVVSRPSEARR
jgi:hypothetical protein